MHVGRLVYGLWTRSGFQDFIAQTFDRQPECLSTGVVVVSDQYFLSCVPHIGGKSTRDASQRKSCRLGVFLPGMTILRYIALKSPKSGSPSGKVKSSGYRLFLRM